MTIWIVSVAAFFGACIGSFLNVVIYRLQPEGWLELGNRSVCPSCRARIAWYDNLPILSYALLGGRARCCKARISFRYPLVELLMAGFAVLAVLIRHVPGTVAGALAPDFKLVAVDMLFLSLVVALSFIDMRDRLLPDVLTKPGMVLAFIITILLPSIHANSFPDLPALHGPGRAFVATALGCATGAGVVWLVSIVGKWWFKQEAMGFGDVKFMGFMGAFVGTVGILLTFFLGCLAGAVVGVVRMLFTNDPYIPFGPFLALGGVITWFWKEQAVSVLTQRVPRFLVEETGGQIAMVSIVIFFGVMLVILRRRRRGP